jgi:hypothetical protein
MEEPGPQLTPSDEGETFAESRTRRLQRNRLVGFFLCIALWVLSVVPLARESMHGREGAGAVAVYLAVAAITLGVAAVIRGMYILLTRRHFWWSPWIFLIAAVAAISIFLAQSAGPSGLINAPSTRAG